MFHEARIVRRPAFRVDLLFPCCSQVMVKTRALLVPPLVQPRSPEFPLGVSTVTLAVPRAEIKAVVIVTCNSSLLTTVVLSVVPLMTTTEDETNWLPFTVRRKPCCTSANVIVVGERDPIIGAGRALPQRGLSALQSGRNSNVSRSALSGRKKTLIRFIRHRTPGGLRECTKGTSNSPSANNRDNASFSLRARTFSLHVLATVYGDVGASEKCCFLRAQVDDRAGDLVWPAESAHWDLRNDLAIEDVRWDGHHHFVPM